MRGLHKIRRITDEVVGEQTETEPKMLKGAIRRKYEAIAYRYYLYAKVHKMPYETVLKCLQTEFYISSGRVADLVVDMTERIREITQQKPTTKELAEKYPYYTWPEPPDTKTKPKTR